MGRQLQLASSKITKPPPALQVYAAVGRHPIPQKKNRDQAHDSEVAYGARHAGALRGSSALMRH